MIPRNPFRLRTAEDINDVDEFLRLFAPAALDVLDTNNFWNNLHVIQSAPGGGKTTLLRLFTPSSLTTLFSLRRNEDLKELYGKLVMLDAVSEQGPRVLGVLHSCARNYASLEDMNLSPAQMNRLFFAILDSRLILAALRGMSELKKLNYPNDLSRITVDLEHNIELGRVIEFPCSGRDIYDWACNLERDAAKVVDSFIRPTNLEVSGHESLISLTLLQPRNFTIDGEEVISRVIIELDDAHKLSQKQRKILTETILQTRPRPTVWVAQRLEALDFQDLTGDGANEGRDYGKPIDLEKFWRDRYKSFEKAAFDIADRRLALVPEISLTSFRACLEDTIDSSSWEEQYELGLDTIQNRIKEADRHFSNILPLERAILETQSTPREKMIALRVLEILLRRDLSKNQQRLQVGIPTHLGNLEKLEDSVLRNAADRMVSDEFKVPYYFGPDRLALLSSSNFDQFLTFAADLFEEILALNLLSGKSILPTDRQELILNRIAKSRWENMGLKIPYGTEVVNLLTAIKEIAKSEWLKGTASYGAAGSISGIAISMYERKRLIDYNRASPDGKYSLLTNVLSTSISNNLLEVHMDRSQGYAGKKWMVMYLNRWLCLLFGLPLQYGGWRHVKLDEMNTWIAGDLRQIRKQKKK